MSLSHSPKIVTNGLVLCLDAADKKSYPETGTTWFDRSGNGNNGTLTNGPAFSGTNGGSIVFDGADDLVITPLISGPSFTWSAWFRSNRFSTYHNIISIDSPSYMLMLVDSSTNMGFWSSDGLTGSSLNMGPLVVNNWYHATFIREGNTITNGYKTYMNGVFRGSANTGNWSSSNITVLGSRQYQGDQPFSGNISQVSIYNRALTPQEIKQNFNATRGRYGI